MVQYKHKIKSGGTTMKRKIAFMLILVMIASLFSGCTGNQTSLFTEFSNFAAWNTASVDITGETSLSIDKLIKFGVSFNAKEQFNKTEGQYYVNMNMKVNGEDNLWKYSDLSASYKFPEVKIYLDKEKLYVNKELILGIYEILGNTPEEFTNLKKDFVAVSFSDEGFTEIYNEIMQAGSGKDTIKYLGFFKDFSSNVNVQKSGSTYTIKLNSDELVDLAVDFIQYYNKNKDELGDIFGTTDMEIPSSEEVNELKELIDGSKFEYKVTFSSNKVIMDFNCKIKIKPMFEDDLGGETTISLNAVYNKNDDAKIKMPTSTVEYTFEEFDNIINPVIEDDYDIDDPSANYDPYKYSDTAIINLTNKTLSNYSKTFNNKTIDIINKDGVTYIPLKPVLEAMKYTVNYDSINKKIYYKDYYNDAAEIKKADVIIINGVSYINVEKLIENGFHIYYNSYDNMHQWKIWK